MELNEETYWGDVVEENDTESAVNYEELFKPKAVECSDFKLHQIYLQEHQTNDEDAYQLSVAPPVDKHGQNLLLHSIELKHHIRKMMLMKMAAQHQQAGGNKNENLPQLPAAPLPPKSYCGKNGIHVAQRQRGFLLNPPEIDEKSPFITGCGHSPVELDSDSLRYLSYKAIAAICCHCGFENAHESTLDVLSDVLGDFYKRFTRLLRIATDAEASQRESRFPNVIEYALQESGMGGFNALWRYWCTNILEYALRLEQEDQRLIADYEKLT
ncbi:STAGA complex 65 subunit gamma-like [Xenia sp. Carnegie-2017]|uniref:STAGA complex 65 subunit gamma-like n=1 Tax=Xenia sp. Carnegie-2017 TaxID=2897299 RepID=UPI001F03C65F|nr:STAGA complex 65 subunit gamma-like [Xenia sp. Carnegie-2017]